MSLQLFTFTIPFTSQFNQQRLNIQNREGIILYYNLPNAFSVSEISPLPGFSKESLDEVLIQLKKDIQKIETFLAVLIANIQTKNIKSYEYFDLVKNFFKKNIFYSSVIFGLESLFISIFVNLRNIYFVDFFNFEEDSKEDKSEFKALKNIKISGVADNFSSNLNREKSLGIKVLKIKLPSKDPIQSANLIAEYIHLNKSDFRFRIDCNAIFTFDEFCLFLIELKNKSTFYPLIEFIEDPFKFNDQSSFLKDLSNFSNTDFKNIFLLALDEVIYNVDDPEEILNSEAISYIVIKPQPLGGFAKTLDLISMIKKHKKKAVISSFLESPIGMIYNFYLASIISSFNFEMEHFDSGLDTLSLFEDNFISFKPEMINGILDVSKISHKSLTIDFCKLKPL